MIVFAARMPSYLCHQTKPVNSRAFSRAVALHSGGTTDELDIKGLNNRMIIKYHPNLILIGKSLEEPIMGKHFQISQRPRPHELPVFDTSLLYVSDNICFI